MQSHARHSGRIVPAMSPPGQIAKAKKAKPMITAPATTMSSLLAQPSNVSSSVLWSWATRLRPKTGFDMCRRGPRCAFRHGGLS
eukprot:scaffold1786_cov398-Prasinococcus_capsulatus_cf.AAC.7